MKKYVWYLACASLVFSVPAFTQEQNDQIAESQEEVVEQKETTESTAQPKKITQEQAATEETEPQSKTTPATEPTPAPQETPGPDTVQLSEEIIGFRGNWVKKREWLLRAKEQNTKIQTLISEIQQSRPAFAEKFTIIQNELDTFYRETGNRTGNLQSSFKSYLREEELENRDRDPSIDEFDDIASFQRDLGAIPKEVDPINKLDAALEERIKKLDEQLQNSRTEGSQAQKFYDEMWDMIDDTKAQSHFYEIKGITKKIKSILEYVQGSFAQDFDATIATTRKQIEEFREKLLDLESTLKALQKVEKERERQRILKTRRKPTTAWHSAITRPFVEAYTMISSFIYSGIETIGGWFSKTTPTKKRSQRLAPSEEKPSEPVSIPEKVEVPQAEPQHTS